ncbi:helix-turn-helix domain-containing protein [Enterobacter mori]|uniref:helix-turn-helix domain-containing protein n=1 Tax=Enterobacter mori TaxID=539813 RepID=UPI00398BA5C0
MITTSSDFHRNVVKDIKMYIHKNMGHKKLTAREICQLSGYSRFYMHRIFRRQTGKSLLQYINELRMEKIESELIYSDKKITDIAADFGYQNLRELTKRFTIKHGIPPSRYRQKHMQNITSSDLEDSLYHLRHRSPGAGVR